MGRAVQPGRMGLGIGQDPLQFSRQLQPQSRGTETLGHGAQAVEGVGIGRPLGRDLVDGLVLEDAAARLVAFLGGALAPDRRGDEG